MSPGTPAPPSSPLTTAPARPRRPHRHAEVRLRRRPQRARAGLGPRDRGPGRRRRAWPSSCSPPSAPRSCSHVVQLGPVPHRPGRGAPAPATSSAVDASEVRCVDPEAEAAMIDEIKAAAKDGDSLGGVVEVLGLRRARRPRQPRPLGPQARRPPRPGAHEHPGREGRRDRRRLRGRRPAGERGARPDRLGRRRRGDYRRTSSFAGGSRAACPPASVLVAHVAMKPLATLNRPVLPTVDTATKEARRSPSRSAPTSPRCPPWAWWPRP